MRDFFHYCDNYIDAVDRSAERFAARKNPEETVAEAAIRMLKSHAITVVMAEASDVRRYDPAMRTCDSALARLQDLSARAERAANLLRTRVDVAAERHNSAVLHSMDRRADLQLRLQETVEGLSVVAISYYAVSLLGYVLAPIAKLAHVDKLWLQAGATPLMLLVVWYFVRAIRRTAAKKRAEE